jgi:hypothetical protein
LAAANSFAILRTLASCRNLENINEKMSREEKQKHTVRVDLVVEKVCFQLHRGLNQLYD